MRQSFLKVFFWSVLVILAIGPISALAEDDEYPGTVGEAFGMFAQQEREDREAEGEYTSTDFGNTTTQIPAAELKKLEQEVRTIFTRMGEGFVAGKSDAVLALYADDYGYMGKKKANISANVTEYLADYDDLSMTIKHFKVKILKSLDDPSLYFADASVIFDRTAVRTGTSKEDRLEKGTPDAVEKMKADPEFSEAGEALEEFYSSQKHPLDDSHKDPTPLGKEIRKNVKANFRLEKRVDSWVIIEAEFGTTRKTVILSPEEKIKKFWVFVPIASVAIFVVGFVLFKVKDLAVTSEEPAVEEGEYTISSDYKKEIEAEIFNFIENLSKGKHDEEVEKLLKAQQWELARHIIRERISIAHELHDRNMGALYARYEKKILEWETRYANFY